MSERTAQLPAPGTDLQVHFRLMPQKPLSKPGKKIEKKTAANRHGKSPQTRKGKLDKPPKKLALLAQLRESKELSKEINAKNEAEFAGKAELGGGKLSMIKTLPPVLAPADQRKKSQNVIQPSAAQ